MKKPEIVELMLKNKSRFHHIKMAEKKPKKGTHKMPDGTVMSGSVHSKDSKPVEKPKPKENTYDEKPVIKKQQELLKLLEDNKDKLKKIDTFTVTSRGKVRDGNFYDATKLKVSTKSYGTPTEAVKRLNYHINKVKEELAKPAEKPVEKAKEKPKAKPKPKSNKEIANELDDAFFKMDLEEALKELKNVDKKDQQSVTNKIIKWNSFVGSLKNKIKKTKDLKLKKLMESVVSAHNKLNTKPKPKPKAQISEVDFMENSYLDDIEKEVKKSKYKDRLDMNTLIDAGENMEKSQRLRAFEIIKKILKTINTKEVKNLYPLEVIKKRLKL